MRDELNRFERAIQNGDDIELTDAEQLRLVAQVELTQILKTKAWEQANWLYDLWAVGKTLRNKRTEERELRTALGRSIRRARVRLTEMDNDARAAWMEWAPVFAKMLIADKRGNS